MGSSPSPPKGNWTELHATRDTQTNKRGKRRWEERHGVRSSCCNFICLPLLSFFLSLPHACLTCHYLMRVHKKLNQNALHALQWVRGEVDREGAETRNAQAKPLAAADNRQKGVGDTHTLRKVKTRAFSARANIKWHLKTQTTLPLPPSLATFPSCILNMQMDTRNYFIIHTRQKAMCLDTHTHSGAFFELSPQPDAYGFLCATPTAHRQHPCPVARLPSVQSSLVLCAVYDAIKKAKAAT